MEIKKNKELYEAPSTMIFEVKQEEEPVISNTVTLTTTVGLDGGARNLVMTLGANDVNKVMRL